MRNLCAVDFTEQVIILNDYWVHYWESVCEYNQEMITKYLHFLQTLYNIYSTK